MKAREYLGQIAKMSLTVIRTLLFWWVRKKTEDKKEVS